MARIRTIKPEFWTDEKLAPLSPICRLTFLGLVSMADDAGRLNAKQLRGFVERTRWWALSELDGETVCGGVVADSLQRISHALSSL